MNDVRRVKSGTMRRILAIDRKKTSAPPPRFMRFSTEAETCCSGTSIYEQIFSCVAIVSSSLPVTLFGYAYKKRIQRRSSMPASFSSSSASPSFRPKSSP